MAEALFQLMPEQPEDVRYFVADNMRDALSQVRTALGREALIVSQQPDGRQVRVGAMLVADEAEITVSEPAQDGQAIYRERLLSLGYDATFCDRVLRQAHSWQDITQTVLDQLPLAAAHQLGRGVWRFVGPAGGGKTATIVKIAAQHIAQHGPHSCVLVSPVHHGLGGNEALALAAELLGVRHLELSEAETSDALRQLDPKHLVLVDSGPEHAETALLKGLRQVLVVPATLQHRVLRQCHSRWQQIHAVVLTHIDEAPTLGEALGTFAHLGVPLLAVGTSNSLRQGLAFAQRDLLTHWAFQSVDRF